MGRLRGFLWLIAGVVVAALAGGVAFVALSQATAQEAETTAVTAPQAEVVVAARAVDVRGILSADDVQLRQVSVEAIPDGAVRDLDNAVGMITRVPIYPGEVLLTQRLVDPNVVTPDGRTALLLNEDEVLLAFPAGDLINQLNVLKSGDHVDFLFTYQLPIDRETDLLPPPQPAEDGTTAEGQPSETVTFNLLQNVTIAAIVRQAAEDGQTGAPRGLLLAVSPQDALVLKYMKDVGATVDLVLRAPGVEGRFAVDPVDLDYIINGYIVPGEVVP